MFQTPISEYGYLTLVPNWLFDTCSVGGVYSPGAELRRRERRPRRGGAAAPRRLRDRAPGAEGEYTPPERCLIYRIWY